MNLCSTSLANMMSTFENIICRSLLKHFLIHIVENHWFIIIIITPINCYWQTAPSLLEHHQFCVGKYRCSIIFGTFVSPVLHNHDYVIALSQCPSVVTG